MQLIVKIINGSEHTLDVASDLRVQDLKNLLAKQINVPVSQQRLMLKGKPLSSDTQTLKEYSIEPGTKLMLIVKKDTETNLTKQLKLLGKAFVTDVDEFALIFNKELKKLVSEMSLDDIERFDESRAGPHHSEPNSNMDEHDE